MVRRRRRTRRSSGVGVARVRSTASGSRRVLLDFMRRELAIKVDALDAEPPGGSQAALEPAADRAVGDRRERDAHVRAALLPRARGAVTDDRSATSTSRRAAASASILRRRGTFPLHQRSAVAEVDDRADHRRPARRAPRSTASSRQVAERVERRPSPGYQLPAAQLRWLAGDGSRAFHDPIRVPRRRPTTAAARTRSSSTSTGRSPTDGQGIEAREHTAQVPPEEREEREERVPRRRSCRCCSARRRWSSASTSPR